MVILEVTDQDKQFAKKQIEAFKKLMLEIGVTPMLKLEKLFVNNCKWLEEILKLINHKSLDDSNY